MSSVTQTCSTCGATLPANARFCGSCGVSLQTTAKPGPTMSSTTPLTSPADDIHNLTFDQALLTAPRPHRQGGRWPAIATVAGGLLLIVLTLLRFTNGLSALGQIVWVVDGVLVIALVVWLWRQYTQRRMRHGTISARRWLVS